MHTYTDRDRDRDRDRDVLALHRRTYINEWFLFIHTRNRLGLLTLPSGRALQQLCLLVGCDMGGELHAWPGKEATLVLLLTDRTIARSLGLASSFLLFPAPSFFL